jgi:hypothetical protein
MKNNKLTHQFQLNQLKNSTEDVIKDKTLSQGLNSTIKGVTEHIDNTPQVPISGGDWMQKIANLRAAKMVGKKVLGAVPVLGGIANAVMSQDASAAVPGLDAAESTGPAAGSLDERIEKGTLTDEDKRQMRLEALQRLK